MPGPGEYLADGTEGITGVEDLPAAKIILRSRNTKRAPCPRGSQWAYRRRSLARRLPAVGDLVAGRPHEIPLLDSQPPCSHCGLYFTADLSDLAPPGSHYTHRMVALAVRLVVEDRLPYRAASWHLWRDHRVFVPFAIIQN